MTPSGRLTILPDALDLSTRAAVQGLALIILFASSLVDMLGSISIGPISSQGIATVVYFVFATMLLPFLMASQPYQFFLISPMLLFVAWAGVSLSWSTARTNGIQNVLAITTFLLLIMVAERTATNAPWFATWIQANVHICIVIGSLLYAGSVIYWGPGTDELIGARSFALFALLGVGSFLARWRYGGLTGLLYAMALTGLIGVSQSRLALGIAVVLFPIAQFPTHRLRKIVNVVAISCVAALLSYGAFIYFEGLRDRFLRGDLSFRIGSIGINGSGRMAFWRVTMESLNETPIAGRGAGSTEGLISSVFLDIRHPHSDYLRLLHDYGIVGVGLWAVAISALIVALWRRWRLAERAHNPSVARTQLTALLGLIGLALAMTMENAIVYIFVTAPLALVLGSALGTPLEADGTRSSRA